MLILLLLAIHQVRSDENCRVLVLEGGGDRGAYHSGVLQKMV